MPASTMDITVSRCMNAWLWGSSMATTVVACPAAKSALATDSTAIGRGPFAHADQHGAVADHMDVAAFDGRRLVVAVLAAVVGGELGPGEHVGGAGRWPGCAATRAAGPAWPWG